MIQIPRCLRQRPKYKGLPIPFTTFIKDGVPDFKVLDIPNRNLCLRRRLCALCGQSLKDTIVFIGGENSIAQRTFVDPAMHEDCALYAAQACPFLANKDGTYSKVESKHDDTIIVRDFNVSSVRPKRMGVYYTKDYKITQQGDNVYILADYSIKVDWEKIP